MAVEVRIVGTQHETLVMELDGLKTSAGVCGMLCGLGCCNITEVTHLHQEVNSEEQCFWALYARTLKQQTDKQRYLFCKFIHELWWSYVKFVDLIYSLHQPREYKVLSASHIWVSHSGVSEFQCHLECDAMTLYYYFPTFLSNTLPSSWVVKESPKNKFIRNLLKDVIRSSIVERQEYGEY